MAHFFGSLRGRSAVTTRLGDKFSGLETVAAGEKGAITVQIWYKDGQDHYRITFGAGRNSTNKNSKIIKEGILNSEE